MIERYTRPEMGRLWSEKTKYRTWLEVELAVKLLAHGTRDAQPAGLGEGLEAGRDVHARPEHPVALEAHVSEVDAHAKLHAPVFGELGVQRCEHAEGARSTTTDLTLIRRP